MTAATPLPRDFYARPAVTVARDLLGQQLIRQEGSQQLAGIIVEAEAYGGEEDRGCHCRAGRTRRTAVMYGPPGFAYIYFTYGMHWMLNVVAAAEGDPAAVLIRAVRPTAGELVMAARRGPVPTRRLTDGPGKLCQAFAIDGRLNGSDLCVPGAELYLAAGAPVPDTAVIVGPRVGLNSVPEPWQSIPWRWRVAPDYLFEEVG
jgi:DNA-3-methyladenine glycosylase